MEIQPGDGALFLAAFVVTVGLLAATGHYGAKMVYEYGMAVNRKEVCTPAAHSQEKKNLKGNGIIAMRIFPNRFVQNSL